MKALKTVAGLILLLALAAAGAASVWFVVTWFTGLTADARSTVTSVVTVVSVPTIAFFTTRALDRRRSRDEAIREHRTELYDDLIKGLMRMLKLGDSDKNYDSDDTMKFLADITPPLIIYGSREVIQKWVAFRKIGQQQPTDLKSTLAAFEDILKAMRKDLGHSVFTQPQFELLSVFVNDTDSLK